MRCNIYKTVCAKTIIFEKNQIFLHSKPFFTNLYGHLKQVDSIYQLGRDNQNLSLNANRVNAEDKNDLIFTVTKFYNMKGKKTAKRKARTPKENPKNEKVWIRCTSDFKTMLMDKAQCRGMTITSYLEYLVMKDKPKERKV